jgi:hypothetical protein
MFTSNETDERARVWVRQNAGSAGIAALLMLYFGFSALAAPTGTGLFERSNWLLYNTVRIGGVAMAVIAAWSLLGNPLVLAVDAVVSTAVGLSLIVSGGGMLIGGGDAFQNAMLILFGMMFVGAGVRNGRLFAHLSARERRASNADARLPVDDEAPVAPVDTLQPSLAARLAERSRQKADTSAQTPAEPESPPTPLSSSERPAAPGDDANPGQQTEPEPERGFLASFGRQDNAGRD